MLTDVGMQLIVGSKPSSKVQNWKIQCENIGWRYINNRSDATRQYISAKNALFKSFFANGVVTCVVVMKC